MKYEQHISPITKHKEDTLVGQNRKARGRNKQIKMTNIKIHINFNQSR